jgi:hypothetical protein
VERKPVTRLLVLTAISLLCRAEQQNPEEIAARMRAAEEANRKQAAYFLYREDVHYVETSRTGTPLIDRTHTYEVTFLEGEPYFRLVEIDGQPLSQERQAEEDAQMRDVERYRKSTPMELRRRQYVAAEEDRYRIDSRLVVERMNLRFVGEDVAQDRKAWVLEATPKRGGPKPRRRSEWALSQRITYWVDQETYIPLRVEGFQLYDFGLKSKGTVTRLDFTPVEGVWLISRIHGVGASKNGDRTVKVNLEQRYSGYQKFRADAVLIFREPE